MMIPRHVVLCSLVLGGAEIFTLETMLANGASSRIYCNPTLKRLIEDDPRYAPLEVLPVVALEPLALNIMVPAVRRAAQELAALLEGGGVLLGNLRAASLQLLSRYASRNDAFIHDNTHYLNLKARLLIFVIAVRSRMIFFPCRHSWGKMPFKAVVRSKVKEFYFATYRPLSKPHVARPRHLALICIGRVEPPKNQLLAFEIACVLRKEFASLR